MPTKRRRPFLLARKPALGGAGGPDERLKLNQEDRQDLYEILGKKPQGFMTKADMVKMYTKLKRGKPDPEVQKNPDLTMTAWKFIKMMNKFGEILGHDRYEEGWQDHVIKHCSEAPPPRTTAPSFWEQGHSTSDQSSRHV